MDELKTINFKSNKMKTIKYLALLFAFSLAFTSCDPNEYDDYGNNQVGGLLEIQESLIPYVLGNSGPYYGNFNYKAGSVSTSEVNIYKKFVRANDGQTSDWALLKTFSSPELSNTYEFTYTELIEGLSVDGAPLPNDDSGLAIGDAWILEFRSTTSEGNIVKNVKTTKVALGTRLAGAYKTNDSYYFHYNDPRPGAFNGSERIIESVEITTDYTVYSFRNFLYWDGDGTTFYFYVDNDPIVNGGDDYQITIPNEYNGEQQLFVGAYDVVSCDEMVGNLTDPFTYTCDDNVVTLMPDGHDIVKMVYGYLGSNSHINPGYEFCVKQ